MHRTAKRTEKALTSREGEQGKAVTKLVRKQYGKVRASERWVTELRRTGARNKPANEGVGRDHWTARSKMWYSIARLQEHVCIVHKQRSHSLGCACTP